MVRPSYNFLLVPVLILGSSSLARSQTGADVREAVANYFADDEAREAARRNLASWGDRALPHLREMAEGDIEYGMQWNLVCSITHDCTDASLDLLVDIVDGRTRVDASSALNAMKALLSSPRNVTYLDAQPRFKPAVLRFADHDRWLQRSQVASVAAAMGWKDTVQLLEPMLEADNFHLRKAAADAIEILTGRDVEIESPPLRFPKQELKPALLEAPRQLSHRFTWATTVAEFTTWFDGTPGLLFGAGKRFELYGGDLETRETPEVGHAMVTIPGDDGRLMVVLAADGVHGGPDYAIAIDAEGNEAWDYLPKRSGIKSIVPLYGGAGIEGVAFAPGGEEGVVAVDRTGAVLWQLENRHVVYELDSHPHLPGRLLVVGGKVELIDHGGPAPSTGPLRRTRVFATQGELFADEDGAPAMIVAGKSQRSEAMIARLDADLKEVWSASLPGRVIALAMVEGPGRSPLFVAAADSGDLVVFDEVGTLQWQGRFPETQSGDDVAVRALAAGTFGDDAFGFVARTLEGTYVYRFDPASWRQR